LKYGKNLLLVMGMWDGLISTITVRPEARCQQPDKSITAGDHVVHWTGKRNTESVLNLVLVLNTLNPTYGADVTMMDPAERSDG
jgi:hypothetical protein